MKRMEGVPEGHQTHEGGGTMKDKYTASTLLTCAGALITVSGILMAVCEELAYGGILWAAASCMFFCGQLFPAG